LPSPKPTTTKIKPADSRHERGTSGGQVRWYRGLRDVAHTLADRVNAGVAWLAERRGHLQRAGREVERELELSEGRRREAETELEVRDGEMDRGLTH